MTTNLRAFIQHSKTNGGGSHSIMTGLTNPTSGYMVSISGFEKRFKQFPTNLELAVYIFKNIVELTREGSYLVLWKNKGGEWFIDVSINIPELSNAMVIGAKHNQLCIWDCAKSEEIPLYKFARKCDITSKGMNEGWVINDLYVKYEGDAEEAVKVIGYYTIESANEGGECYYTEWESLDDDEYFVSRYPDGSEPIIVICGAK